MVPPHRSYLAVNSRHHRNTSPSSSWSSSSSSITTSYHHYIAMRFPLPSGNLTGCYWRWPFMVDLPMKKLWFSIAMLVYQRVYSSYCWLIPLSTSWKEGPRGPQEGPCSQGTETRAKVIHPNILRCPLQSSPSLSQSNMGYSSSWWLTYPSEKY